MIANPLFNLYQQEYSRTGNLLGLDQGRIARISDERRRFNPMQITGSQTARTQWVTEQAVQDVERGNLVVLRDPVGVATADVVARLGKTQVKNVVWIDLDNHERLFQLHPFPTRNADDKALVAQWEAALVDSLKPLSVAGEQTLRQVLHWLYLADDLDDYVPPCFTTFWAYLAGGDFPRYFNSKVPVALSQRRPADDAIANLRREVGPKLAELFALNHWRSSLTFYQKMTNPTWLDSLHSHPRKQVCLVAITGGSGIKSPVIQTALDFGLWRHIHQWQSDRGGLPVFAYTLEDQFFASPAVLPMLQKPSNRLSLTTAHNDPQGWLNYPLTGSLSDNGRLLELEDGDGVRVLLKRPVPDARDLNYNLARISRRYCAMLYGRRAEFCLAEQEALLGPKHNWKHIYADLGEAPWQFLEHSRA